MVIDSFESYHNVLVEQIGIRLRSDLGADSCRFDAQIGIVLQRIRAELDRRVTELCDNRIFPAFKASLTEQQKTELSRTLQHAPIYPRFEEPSTMMVTRDENYQEQLNNFPQDFLRFYYCYATSYLLRNRLSSTPYWGKLQYQIVGRDACIPVDVRITPVAVTQ